MPTFLPPFGKHSPIPMSPQACRADLRRHGARALLASVLLAASPLALSQAVDFGDATGFGVVGASAITSTGPTVINGDLGISPGNASSVTGFSFSTPPGPGLVNGTPHFADALAQSAQTDAGLAYDDLAARACNTTISADLGGSVLPPGVYCSASSMGLTGTLTLDAQNNPNAIFVFQVGSALTTASNATVNIINGSGCNVFWQIGSSATLGTGTQMLGNIIALESITLTTGADISGRLIARTGAVTLDSSEVSVCSFPGGGGDAAREIRIIPATSPLALTLLVGTMLIGLALVPRLRRGA